jgi:hypothetical protein
MNAANGKSAREENAQLPTLETLLTRDRAIAAVNNTVFFR